MLLAAPAMQGDAIRLQRACLPQPRFSSFRRARRCRCANGRTGGSECHQEDSRCHPAVTHRPWAAAAQPSRRCPAFTESLPLRGLAGQDATAGRARERPAALFLVNTVTSLWSSSGCEGALQDRVDLVLDAAEALSRFHPVDLEVAVALLRTLVVEPPNHTIRAHWRRTARMGWIEATTRRPAFPKAL
jgi:hypothetical protein